jgi:hypothetical protein
MYSSQDLKTSDVVCTQNGCADLLDEVAHEERDAAVVEALHDVEHRHLAACAKQEPTSFRTYHRAERGHEGAETYVYRCNTHGK